MDRNVWLIKGNEMDRMQEDSVSTKLEIRIKTGFPQWTYHLNMHSDNLRYRLYCLFSNSVLYDACNMHAV